MNLSLLDIDLGSIISDINPITQVKNKFIVVGSSATDYAIIRLFEGALETTTWLAEYIVEVETEHIRMHENKTFQADCSKILIRKFGTIGTWLKKHPDSLYGRLTSDDLSKITEILKNAKTIPRYIKSQFDF